MSTDHIDMADITNWQIKHSTETTHSMITPENFSSTADPCLLIGCAAGFSGDRVDAASTVVDTMIAHGGPAFLIFETLAERTLALAQLRRRADPSAGY